MHDLGGEILSIHLEKNCSRCIKQLSEIKMENDSPADDFSQLFEIISKAKEILGANALMDEETKKTRRIGLFNNRKLFVESEMVSKNGDGSNNYALLKEHIMFLEEFSKDIKTVHSAYETARICFVNNASLSEREKIAESDRKYKPKFVEREKQETEKLTIAQKNIAKLVKAGLSKEAAEKIIFGV
jgi:hypothetical protein